MFGREYWRQPSILLSSFGQMHSKYKKIAKRNKKDSIFQKLYIGIFGIPEIGFQIRSLYFVKILKEKLENKKIKNILDAGSGIGTYSFLLANKFPDSRVFGGDIDEEKIKFCKSFSKKMQLPNVEFGYFDVEKPSFKHRFDLIVNIDVLEHVNDYKKVIKNFNKLLNEGGYLYIHAPQTNQKRIFSQLKKWEHEDHTHEGYSVEDLKNELKKSGFKVTIAKESFGFFGKLSWELNHMSFKKGFLFSGLTYPLLYVIASIDLLFDNRNGLGTAILAKKK